jgi:ABC-type transporter lipoprotein component MlaA
MTTSRPSRMARVLAALALQHPWALINDRSMNLELFENVEESVLDLYSGMRNLYVQRRDRAIRE